MKKSFLSRAMSAALAVPFALSQTILCASFAVDETADASALQTLTIDDFKKVPVKDSDLSPITEVEKYVKYEKSSTWNGSLQGWTNTLMGQKITLDAARLADSISSQAWYAEILKEAMANPEYANAVAEIGLDEIVVTVDVNYPYATAMSEMFKKKFAEKYPDLDMSFEADGVLSGTVVLTASTEALDDYTIPFDVKFIGADTEKDSLTIDGLFDYVETTLNNAKNQALTAVDNKVAEYQNLKDEKEAELAEKEAELAEKLEELEAKKAELAEKLVELEEKKADLDAAQADLDTAEAEGADTTAEQAKLDDATKKYNDAKQQADDAQAKADDADAKAADAQAKAADAHKQLDDAQTQLDEAEAMAKGEIDDMVDSYLKKIQNSRERVNKLKDSYEKSYTGTDVNDLIQQAKDEAEKVAPSQSNRIDKVPDTLEEFADTNIYAQLVKVFTETLTQINEQAAIKAYDIDLSADDILGLAEEMYDITVTGSASKDAQGYGVANGTVLGYLNEDEDLDLEYYYDYFNDLFAKENKQVVADSIKTEKVVEAAGNMVSDTMNGEVRLEIKRVITLEVEDLEETTTTSSEDLSSDETTTTSSDDLSSDETTTTSSDDKSSDETTTTSSDDLSSDETTTTSSDDKSSDETTTTSSDDKSSDETTTTSSDDKSSDETTTTSSNDQGDSSETTTSHDDNNGSSSSETTTSHDDKSSDSSETTTTSGEPGDNNGSETTTTPPTGDVVKAWRFYAEGDTESNRNFYFSHDPRPFDVSDLIGKAYVREVTEVDGQEFVSEEEKPVELEKVSFGLTSAKADATLSPADVFAKLKADNQEAAYTLTPLYIFYDGYLAENQVYVYIGVKGDTDLNGTANASDGSKVLTYAANIGAGMEAYLTVDEGTPNAAKEAFAYFLADVNGESKDNGKTSSVEGSEAESSSLDAGDAASILSYAASFGAKGSDTNWVTDVLNPNGLDSIVLPKFTKAIYDWEVANKNTEA